MAWRSGEAVMRRVIRFAGLILAWAEAHTLMSRLMKTAPIVTTSEALRVQLSAWRAAGARIGLVPTMGALHAGHLSLAEQIRKRADRVVVSIFVNPAQFAPHEDFDRYPRALAADLDKLGSRADLVFAPAVGEMYPDGFAT